MAPTALMEITIPVSFVRMLQLIDSSVYSTDAGVHDIVPVGRIAAEHREPHSYNCCAQLQCN